MLSKYSAVNSGEILDGIIKAMELISSKIGEKFYRVLVDEVLIFTERTGRAERLNYILKRLSRTKIIYSNDGEVDSHSFIISEVAPNNSVDLNIGRKVENNIKNEYLPNIEFKME